MLRVQTTHCAALNKLKANGRDTVPKAWWMQDQEQEGGNCEFSFPKKGGLLIDCDTKIVYVETLSQIGEPMYTETIWLQPTESSNISTYLVVPFFKLQWILYEKVAKTYWKSNSAWNNFSSITVVYDIERELVQCEECLGSGVHHLYSDLYLFLYCPDQWAMGTATLWYSAWSIGSQICEA